MSIFKIDSASVKHMTLGIKVGRLGCLDGPSTENAPVPKANKQTPRILKGTSSFVTFIKSLDY